MGELLYADITEKIIGAAFEVHKSLGKGLTEKTYQRALSMRLRDMGLDVEEEKYLPILFWNKIVGTQRVDLLVARKVIVENKAIHRILNDHTAKLLATLRNTKYQLGLIINFRSSVQVKRVINTIQNK